MNTDKIIVIFQFNKIIVLIMWLRSKISIEDPNRLHVSICLTGRLPS